MKFSRGFSIFILLFILQASIAVNCPNEVEATDLTIKLIGSKTCDDACVYFSCTDRRKCSGKMEDYGVEYQAGCPQDFYDKCSTNFSSDVKTVQDISPNRMDYEYKYTIQDNVSRTVFYISGCGGETDGTQCLGNYIVRSSQKIYDGVRTVRDKNKYFYYNDGNGTSRVGDSSDNGECPDDGKDSDDDKSRGNGSDSSHDPNGALKFLGIIAIGWSIAAWIY